jgi:heme exporter protein A
MTKINQSTVMLRDNPLHGICGITRINNNQTTNRADFAINSYMISTNNLSFERYFERVFEPVSFDLKAGSLLLVTGSNGCGKTTLLRLLAGLLEPSEGDFHCHNQPLYAGHNPAIKDDLSVQENIRFWMSFMGTRETKPTPELLNEVINKVGLSAVAQQEGRTLSAGQRKRCSLARLLFCDEALWLLDEPYSNLDREGIAMLNGIIKTHLDTGGGCVLTTHGSLRPEGFEMQECHLESGRHHDAGATA